MCYTYDSLNRVTKRTTKNLSNTVLSEESFTYDAAGNVTDAPNSCFQYDTNNRLVVFNGNSVSYDLDGNMLSNASLSCTYDSANRLVTAGGHTYTYNAEDVRIRNLCSDADTTYTYDTNCKLSKLLCKTTNGVTTKYVYGRGLIGEEKCGAFKTYHFDCRGSTIAITDASGNITDTFAYDTYGKCISHTGNSFVIFGYNGRDGVMTDKNGLIYMRARYYSPEMKRFINADIIAGSIDNAVTLNRFAYANGNPVSLVDPFGLWSLKHAWNSFTNWIDEKIVDPVINTYNNLKDRAVNVYNEAKEKIVDPIVEKAKTVGQTVADRLNIDDSRDVMRLVADAGVTAIASTSGMISGYSEFKRNGGFVRPISALASGITKGFATFGAVNNAANAFYYNLISNGESDLTSTSYSVGGNARYINRWDRLDYTKQQTQQSNYNFNAWMYYSEYNFHMHVWNGLNLLGIEETSAFSDFAERASDADVEANDPFYDYNYFMEQDDPKNAILRTAAYFLVGFLGL